MTKIILKSLIDAIKNRSLSLWKGQKLVNSLHYLKRKGAIDNYLIGASDRLSANQSRDRVWISSGKIWNALTFVDGVLIKLDKSLVFMPIAMESFQAHEAKKLDANEDRRKHNIGPGNG